MRVIKDDSSENCSFDENGGEENIPMCRICRSTTGDIHKAPCFCKGNVGYIHDKCLRQWIRCRNRSHCEICTRRFDLNRNRDYVKLIKNFFTKKYINVVCRELLQLALFLHSSYAQATELLMLTDLFISEEKNPSILDLFFPVMIAFTGIFNIMMLEWSLGCYNELYYALTYLWRNDSFSDDEREEYNEEDNISLS